MINPPYALVLAILELRYGSSWFQECHEKRGPRNAAFAEQNTRKAKGGPGGYDTQHAPRTSIDFQEENKTVLNASRVSILVVHACLSPSHIVAPTTLLPIAP